jgi:hypothetical protein
MLVVGMVKQISQKLRSPIWHRATKACAAPLPWQGPLASVRNRLKLAQNVATGRQKKFFGQNYCVSLCTV